MQVLSRDKHSFVLYESMSEFVEKSLEPGCAHKSNNDSHSQMRTNAHRAGFIGMDKPMTCDQIAELSNAGWEDGAKRIQNEMDSLAPPPVQGIRRRPVWRDFGDEVNMDRVRCGQLDTAWWGMSRRLGQQPPRIRVAVNMCINARTDSGVVFMRGAAGVRLAEILTSAGYQVELWAGASSKGDHSSDPDTTGYACLVKPYSAPFDDASAAAGCALPAMFRTIGITAIYKNAHKEWPSAGYAIPLETEALEEDGTRLFVVPDNITTKQMANDWLKACIDTLQTSYEMERENAA